MTFFNFFPPLSPLFPPERATKHRDRSYESKSRFERIGRLDPFMTDSAMTMIISKSRKRLGKFLFYGKTSKSGCKGEGQIKSFLLFRREIPRANKEGRYGRAACTYQHNRGGEEETRVRLKKREEEEKKEERSITPPWHRC